MYNKYINLFDEKINHFSAHDKYSWLRKEADKAKSYWGGYGLDAIIYQDFLERIVAMPLDYIRGWLDGENQLKWRQSDERTSKAIKGGFEHLLEKYDHHEIHRIDASAKKFYKKYGWSIVEDATGTYAIKEESV